MASLFKHTYPFLSPKPITIAAALESNIFSSVIVSTDSESYADIAKHYGAEVTGVDNAAKLELMKSLGADHVIDYKKEDFTKNGLAYDLIIDVKGTCSISEYRNSLQHRGKFFLIVGPTSRIFTVVFFGSLGSKKVKLVLYKKRD